MTPLRTAAIDAVVDRLDSQVVDAAVERARRAPVDTDKEDLPRIVVTGGGWTADTSVEPGYTHYAISIIVTGYAGAEDDIAAEDAVTSLHADVVSALAAWTPAAAGLGDMVEADAEFTLFGADESAKPAGMFTANFSMLATVPSGSPYTIT